MVLKKSKRLQAHGCSKGLSPCCILKIDHFLGFGNKCLCRDSLNRDFKNRQFFKPPKIAIPAQVLGSAI